MTMTGYKQTEIGIIPEDWYVNEFKNVVKKFIDYRGVTPKKLGMEWGQGDICALSANNVQMGFIDFNKECYFASEKLYKRWMRNGDCELNDILITMEAPLGNVAFIPDNNKYILSQRTVLIKPKDFIRRKFLQHLMSGDVFQKILLENSTGSTAQGIQRQKLEKILIYYPITKSEQTAIATTLSDFDSLITSMRKLIDKKKMIKQGVMQELLTGKRRLPGFDKEWVTNPIGDLFKLNSTFSKSPFIQESGYFLIMDMGSISVDGKNIAYKRTDFNQDILCEGDLVMPKDDIGGGFIIGKVAYIDLGLKYVLGDHVYKLKLKSNSNSSLFFSYLINSDQINQELKKKVSGSAQLGLGRQSVNEQLVCFPADFPEQNEIAHTLFDMDFEINKLESKLSKLKSLKQGAMQQLLTGKIRLL